MQPEYGANGRTKKNQGYYVLGVDVGRKDCTSEIVVIKVTPQLQGAATKSIVNLYTLDATHFEEQCIKIKQLYYKYGARIVAIDANGLF